ncbi:MAG: hypothetical protein R2795_20130 [Saprospiraceae bacterium]
MKQHQLRLCMAVLTACSLCAYVFLAITSAHSTVIPESTVLTADLVEVVDAASPDVGMLKQLIALLGNLLPAS